MRGETEREEVTYIGLQAEFFLRERKNCDLQINR